jgi:ubiquitin-activating enzyme E1
LHDEGNVELWDLSSNFVFSENDIGKNRAAASVSKLQELNNAVLVQSLTTKLTKEQLSNFQVFLLLLYSYFCSPSIFFPNASICIS